MKEAPVMVTSCEIFSYDLQPILLAQSCETVESSIYAGFYGNELRKIT